MLKHILVVDDKEGIRDSFLLSIESDRCTIETASTAEEGIEKAGKKTPDLIFLDITMPGMGGVAALREFHKICPGVSIYVVTAFHEEYMHELEELKTEGIDFEICRKPLGREQIQLIVDSVLG